MRIPRYLRDGPSRDNMQNSLSILLPQVVVRFFFHRAVELVMEVLASHRFAILSLPVTVPFVFIKGILFLSVLLSGLPPSRRVLLSQRTTVYPP